MTKRKNYSPKTIRNYWSGTDIWHEKFDSKEEFLEEGTCFACGFVPIDARLERAHIKALWMGGNDTIDNIHLLCIACHQASEELFGNLYWNWFKKRNIFDVILSGAAKYNLLSDLLCNLYENDKVKNS
jgi:hypothetical protein